MSDTNVSGREIGDGLEASTAVSTVSSIVSTIATQAVILALLSVWVSFWFVAARANYIAGDIVGATFTGGLMGPSLPVVYLWRIARGADA